MHYSLLYSLICSALLFPNVTVMGLGDAGCQRFIEKKPLAKLDKQRFTNAAIVGAAWSGFCSVQVKACAYEGSPSLLLILNVCSRSLEGKVVRML